MRQRVLDNYEASLSETQKLPHMRNIRLMREHGSIALLRYALGYPLEDVRSEFGEAGRARLTFYLDEASLPAFVLARDPAHSGQRGTPALDAADSGEKEDYSLSNSRDGYFGVCQALIADEDELARRLSALIWDPPNAGYIGRRSEVCTPNDQRLAYAFRELLGGNRDGVLTELKGIRAGSKQTYDTDQATMIRSLVTGETFTFRDALESYLFWHRRRAVHKWNLDAVDFFLCLPGLALCREAIRRKVCDPDLFPQDNPFLPLELIQVQKLWRVTLTD
jgi:hypothetical protein